MTLVYILYASALIDKGLARETLSFPHFHPFFLISREEGMCSFRSDKWIVNALDVYPNCTYDFISNRILIYLHYTSEEHDMLRSIQTSNSIPSLNLRTLPVVTLDAKKYIRSGAGIHNSQSQILIDANWSIRGPLARSFESPYVGHTSSTLPTSRAHHLPCS